MRTLSREELFDLAWSRPLTKVAREFGVTSTALKKTCRRHHIPTPSRGYWAAVAAGGVFPRPKLGKAARSDLETIRIVGAVPVSDTVAEATSVARARVAELETFISSPNPESSGDRPPPQLSAEHRRDLAPTAKAVAKIRTGSDRLAKISGRGVVPMTITPAVAEPLMAWRSRSVPQGLPETSDITAACRVQTVISAPEKRDGFLANREIYKEPMLLDRG